MVAKLLKAEQYNKQLENCTRINITKLNIVVFKNEYKKDLQENMKN